MMSSIYKVLHVETEVTVDLFLHGVFDLLALGLVLIVLGFCWYIIWEIGKEAKR